jgi:hypothetical protein
VLDSVVADEAVDDLVVAVDVVVLPTVISESLVEVAVDQVTVEDLVDPQLLLMAVASVAHLLQLPTAELLHMAAVMAVEAMATHLEVAAANLGGKLSLSGASLFLFRSSFDSGTILDLGQRRHTVIDGSLASVDTSFRVFYFDSIICFAFEFILRYFRFSGGGLNHDENWLLSLANRAGVLPRGLDHRTAYE